MNGRDELIKLFQHWHAICTIGSHCHCCIPDRTLEQAAAYDADRLMQKILDELRKNPSRCYPCDALREQVALLQPAREEPVTARDDLIAALNEEHNPSYWGDAPRDAEALADAYRDEVALQLGRDLMEMGLVPFLERLVGPENTDRVFEIHVGEA